LSGNVFTVRQRHCCEYEIKRSRFIAVVAPTPDLDHLNAFLADLAAHHPQATHIVHAWRIQTPRGLRERAFDAGEPSGTAGRPILKHLHGKHLINLCLAVVRYFGGVKLGAGGLARAYGHAAQRVLEKAAIIPYVTYRNLEVEVDYGRYQTLARELAAFGATVLSADYGARVKVLLQIPEEHFPTVRQILSTK